MMWVKKQTSCYDRQKIRIRLCIMKQCNSHNNKLRSLKKILIRFIIIKVII